MPKYKKYRRRPFRSRRGLRRGRYSRRRRFIRKATKIYFYKRNVLKSSFNQAAASDLMGAMNFQLAEVPSYTEFTALYDEYKICRVKVRFIPQFNMQQLSVPASGVVVPKLFTVIDTTDSGPAVNINDLRQYPTCKVTRGFKSQTRYFKPKAASALYGGGVFTSYGVASPWIATTSDTVQHYGIKYAVDAGAATQTDLQRWDVECTYYLAFRRPK